MTAQNNVVELWQREERLVPRFVDKQVRADERLARWIWVLNTAGEHKLAEELRRELEAMP